MSHLGEQLRHAREQQGLTLSQVALETRILQQSLIALEEGTYDLLPGDVVVKGFIRNYSQYLGLPVDEMLELYRQDRGLSTPIRVVPASKMVSNRSYVLPSFFGVFFVTIALVGLTYVALSAVGRVGNPSLSNQSNAEAVMQQPPTPTPLDEDTSSAQAFASESDVSSATSPVPDESTTTIPRTTPSGIAGVADMSEENTPMTTSETPVPSESPTPAGSRWSERSTTPTATPVIVAGFSEMTPTEGPTAEAPIMVELFIKPGTADCWLRVKTDGNTSYEQIMRSGEREVFQAQRQVDIRAGNPTVVFVSVNGSRPEPLGAVPGKPVNWSWPPM